MSILLFGLPEAVEDYPSWLEQRLVSPDFGQLLSEIRAFRDESSDEATLDELLGNRKREVLESGLGKLEPATVRRLLAAPSALEDLLLEIHVEGSDYWRTKLSSSDVPASAIPDELRVALRQSKANPQRPHVIDAALSTDNASISTVPLDHDSPRTPAVRPGPTESDSRMSRKSWGLVAVLAMAAVLLLMFSMRPDPSPDGWGWDRDGVFTADLTADAYLEHLADAGKQWFNKTPRDSDELKIRLIEFRRGCDRLIAAPHPQLTPEDRDWLIERCQVWSAKLDEHLAALDSGQSVDEVQREADETVMKLIQALENRASDVA